MACRHGRDPDTARFETFAGRDLQDLAVDGLACRVAQAAGHHDGRRPVQRRQRRAVEVVGVAMRDHHEVQLTQLARIGQGTVPLQRPEPIAQERIGQDAPLGALEQDCRVPDVADLERRRTHGRGVRRPARRAYRRRAGRRPDPSSGLAPAEAATGGAAG